MFFRFTTAGESHGKALVAVVEGMPAGLPVDVETINRDLWRRQQGYGRGGRMKIETDTVEILSGIRHGNALGSPIALLIKNDDFVHWEEVAAIPPESPLNCADDGAQREMIKLIDQTKADGDTLGGIFEVIARGLPVGLGSHMSWNEKLDGQIAQALMSIHAVKAVEIGTGVANAAKRGSEVHDEIFWSDPATAGDTGSFYRPVSYTHLTLPTNREV